MINFAIDSDELGGLFVFVVWIIIAGSNIVSAAKKRKQRATNARTAFRQPHTTVHQAAKRARVRNAFNAPPPPESVATVVPEAEEAPYVPLAQQEAPSIVHAREHIDAPAPMGTVEPPPPVPPTPTDSAPPRAVTPLAMPRPRYSHPVRLSRSRRALRDAIMYREVLSRPRCFDL
jgi:hypothetical protein